MRVLRRKSALMKPIRGRTPNQNAMFRAMAMNNLVLVNGVFGTGKTYLALAHACQQLDKEQIDKIVLTRVVGHLNDVAGFLPGTLDQKMDGYFVQQLEYLNEFLGCKKVKKLREEGAIEFLPVGILRGRNFDNTIVIIDEVQNASKAELLLLLTRLGKDSKLFMLGDIDQCDYPGVSFFEKMLDQIEDDSLAIVELGDEDCQRHGSLVHWYRLLQAVK